MSDRLPAPVSVDRIREHIRRLEGVRHPRTAPQALDRAADYIQASFSELRCSVEPRLFREGGREFRNVLATRVGSSRPEERVLVISHYDTVEDSPGADDNASGVAVLLELARVLEPVVLGRTLQYVAVSLEECQREGPIEEVGIVGSRALATEAAEQGWQIAGAIVFDAIACAGKRAVQKTPAGLPMKLPECGDFIAVVGNAVSGDWVELFARTVGRCHVPLPVVPFVVPGNGEQLRDTRRSDHVPFWDRGHKAILLTDTGNFRNPNYHRPTDILETLNLPFAAEVCGAVAGMVAEVAK